MKLRRLPMALPVLTLALPSALFAQKVVVDQTVATGNSHGHVSPWQNIEALGKLENPSDANSVHALIGAILDFPHSFGTIPPVMREIVEQNLVQAETNYRLGRSPGIQEKSLVEIANTLADRFRLPEFALVTLHQVEVLRLGTELSMPSFMGPASSQNEDSGASLGASDLSPAQAAYILLALFDQKMINPDYQLPPDEWEKTQYQPAMDRLLKYKELRDSGQLAKTPTHGVLISGPSIKDLRSSISNAVSQMSLTEGLDLVEQAFRIAGINK